MTFIILRVIKLFTPLRMPDDELEVGDLAVHDEEAYPADEGYTRVEASWRGRPVGAAPARRLRRRRPLQSQAGDAR